MLARGHGPTWAIRSPPVPASRRTNYDRGNSDPAPGLLACSNPPTTPRPHRKLRCSQPLRPTRRLRRLRARGVPRTSRPPSWARSAERAVCILLAIVTFGIYVARLVLQGAQRDEAALRPGHRRRSRTGPGALHRDRDAVHQFFRGGRPLRATRPGQAGLRRHRPLVLPWVFILVGPLVWFIKTNGALNSYWRSLGAV